jgi:type II secretory pathway pseudopilin PulG
MQITLEDKGQPIGPFTLDQVREKLARGEYQLSGLAWYEGAPGWLPLSAVPGIDLSSPPTIPGSFSPPRTSALAIWSLVLGVLSFLCSAFSGIPAIICGHLALSKIKKSGGIQTGGGLAVAGLITGYLGTFLIGIAFIAGLTAPLVIRQRKKADQTQALSNARSMGLALFEFEQEYGDYPNEATAAKVAENTNSPKVTGNSSNARFRQLFQAGFSGSELQFYSKSEGSRKPDNIFTDGFALEPGECGFAYVGNLDPKDETPRPIAMTPMVPGTDRFDPMPFGGKAVILWTDNSVRSLPIDRVSGQVMLDGKNLFDPGHPVWSGKAPLILLPE